MQPIMKIELSISGDTRKDLCLGLQEIQDEIEATHTEGKRTWETGSYAFVVLGEELPIPQPGDQDTRPDLQKVTIMYRNNYEGGDGWVYYALPVTISAFCPECGARRGDAQIYPQCEDGEWFYVSRWTNPCGHKDPYEEVWKEAEALKKGEPYTRTTQVAQQ